MNQIANPPGFQFLESLFQLINNEKEVKRILEVIRKARDEANEKIAVVGSIAQIGRLKELAQASVTEASVALEQARDEARSILSKAKARDARESDKQQTAAADIAEAEAKVEQREKSVGAREKEIQKHMDQSKALHKEATELKVRSDLLIQKAEEQLAIFKSAASSIN